MSRKENNQKTSSRCNNTRSNRSNSKVNDRKQTGSKCQNK